MKPIESKIAGLHPLTSEEEKTISGGFWLQVLGGAAAIVVSAIVTDWDNFKAGLSGGPERQK